MGGQLNSRQIHYSRIDEIDPKAGTVSLIKRSLAETDNLPLKGEPFPCLSKSMTSTTP